MPYDWKKAEESGGGNPMPDGIHHARVSKIKTGLTTKKGDPMIAVTFMDSTGESESLFTLSDSAAWNLARLLSRCGVDLEEVKADGIEPKHFSQQKIAEQYLLESWVWIRVFTLDATNPKNLDKNGKPYRRVEALHKEEAEKVDAEAVKRVEVVTTPAGDDSDVPF